MTITTKILKRLIISDISLLKEYFRNLLLKILNKTINSIVIYHGKIKRILAK